MKKPKDEAEERDELREEYDFSGGVRGKYAARYAEGTNLVLVDPELAKRFPDSAAVNAALRTLVKIVDIVEHEADAA